MKESNEKKLPGNCFVIMPFGIPFDDYYRDLIRPGITKAGMKAIRGDEINKPGVIMNQIWKGINEAEMCLADLSGRNANVLYEIGLANAIGKPVVQIVQDVNDIPFDLRNLRYIEYKTSEVDWKEKLKLKICEMLEEIKAGVDFPVLPPFSTNTFGVSDLNEYHQKISNAKKRIWICQTWLPGVESYAERILKTGLKDIRILLASFKPGSPIFPRIYARNIEPTEAKTLVSNSVKRFCMKKKKNCLRFSFGHHPGWIAVIDNDVLWGPTPLHKDNHSLDFLFSKDTIVGDRAKFWVGQFSLLWDGWSHNGKKVTVCHNFKAETKFNKHLSGP